MFEILILIFMASFLIPVAMLVFGIAWLWSAAAVHIVRMIMKGFHRE